MGFSRSGDGHNHWQGAVFSLSRARSLSPRPHYLHRKPLHGWFHRCILPGLRTLFSIDNALPRRGRFRIRFRLQTRAPGAKVVALGDAMYSLNHLDFQGDAHW